jgi:putative nucleotidyltransferase with HDIG domain
MMPAQGRRTADALGSDNAAPQTRLTLQVFGGVLVALGAIVLLRAAIELVPLALDYRYGVLTLLTLASAGYKIKVPGRPVSVGTSEVFIFATILLFGTPAATLMVAFDGIGIAFVNGKRPLHRMLFNLAEPIVSVWTAGQVFGMCSVAVQGVGFQVVTAWIPIAAMAAAYLIVKTQLTSFLLSAEQGTSVMTVWRQHAPILGVNYYAAASLATLGAAGGSNLSLAIVGMAAPLLALSYVAHKEATSRIDEADRHVGDLEHLYQATIEALAIAVDVKDQVTHGHIRRVQRHCLALAEALGVSDERQIKALAAAALLHDVGKLCVPDHVLNKPGALKAGEYDTMKKHAVQGATILSAVEFPYPVVPIVRHHHETWNGRGYPDGLKGEEIPFGARILAVVDCFDALTSDRPYRRKLSDDVAMQMIRERSGTAYDPRIVARFLEIVPDLRRQDQVVEAAAPLAPAPGQNASARPSAIPIGPAAPGASTTETMRLSGNVASLHAVREVGEPMLVKLRRQVPDAEACLFAVAPTGDYLFPASTTPAAQVACQRNLFPLGTGLSGWVAAHRHTIVNSDASLDFPEEALELGFRSATSTPVFAFGTVAAVLTVYLPSRAVCTDAVVRFIGLLAQEVAADLVSRETRREQAPEQPRHARVMR